MGASVKKQLGQCASSCGKRKRSARRPEKLFLLLRSLHDSGFNDWGDTVCLELSFLPSSFTVLLNQASSSTLGSQKAMFWQAEAIIMYLGLNWTQRTGSLWSPFSTHTFVPFSAFQMWILGWKEDVQVNKDLFLTSCIITISLTFRLWTLR